jgi:cyclic dehypoxanthinyl futalosine synthase
MDDILSKIKELETAGGTQVMLQGGIHPDHTLGTYVHMVKTVKEHFPDIVLHSFSPTELVHISLKSGVSLDDAVKALKAVGLDSVPGASDLLVDRIRKIVSPKKINTAQWRQVMETLHQNGLKSSATMTYGMGETLDERIEHLMTVREIQDRTGIIRAFIPWSFSPANTRMSHILPATGVEYLQIVAISRIVLDNIRYLQAGWLTEGLKPAQVALAFGANDMGGILTEEVVVRAAGVTTTTNREKMIDIIANAGKIPVRRNSDYRVMERLA